MVPKDLHDNNVRGLDVHVHLPGPEGTSVDFFF